MSTENATPTAPRGWYELHDNLAGVAAWATGDDGKYQLPDDELLEFVTEPWHFDHLYVAWRIWIAAENAEDNRMDARMEAGAL